MEKWTLVLYSERDGGLQAQAVMTFPPKENPEMTYWVSWVEEVGFPYTLLDFDRSDLVSQKGAENG